MVLAPPGAAPAPVFHTCSSSLCGVDTPGAKHASGSVDTTSVDSQNNSSTLKIERKTNWCGKNL